MTKTETELEQARIIFVSHLDECLRCGDFNHTDPALASLCYRGTMMFHTLLQAEIEYIKKICKIPPNGDLVSLRRRALEYALRNETP